MSRQTQEGVKKAGVLDTSPPYLVFDHCLPQFRIIPHVVRVNPIGHGVKRGERVKETEGDGID